MLTREQVEEFAEKTSMEMMIPSPDFREYVASTNDLVKFARLVWNAAIEKAAKACEDRMSGSRPIYGEDFESSACADSIRQLKEEQ